MLAETVGGHTMRWTLDASGRIVERVTPSGVLSDWVLDRAGRRTGVELASQPLVKCAFRLDRMLADDLLTWLSEYLSRATTEERARAAWELRNPMLPLDERQRVGELLGVWNHPLPTLWPTET